jgi:thiol:disulfide interchange protein
MEETTFKDAAVQDRLKKYHFIHYQAEDPSDPQVKAVSEYFNVKGLPTYVVLRNKN